MYNILICDDERDIVSALEIYLSAEGYGIYKAYTGREAIDVLENSGCIIHLILMDIMMPDMNGLEATAKIREDYNVPIVFLTAKSEMDDKILGLGIGGDDYITKPFSPIEVIARIKSQLRRYATLGGIDKKPDLLSCGGLELDDTTKTVTLDGDEVSLTPIEFDILRLFMTTPGKVYSISEIYREVWKNTPIGNESSVPVHIRHLREKIEINPSEPRYIKVVWGQGYRLSNEKKHGV